MEYWHEFTHFFYLGVALTFLITGFILLFKIGLAKVPIPGLQQAFAAA